MRQDRKGPAPSACYASRPTNRTPNKTHGAAGARVAQLGSLRRPRAEATSRGQRRPEALWRGCRLPRARCLPVSYGRWNGGLASRLPEPRISRRFAHADRPTSGWGDRPVARAVVFDVHVICFLAFSESTNQRRAGPMRPFAVRCGPNMLCCRIARVPVDLDCSVPMYVFLCKK